MFQLVSKFGQWTFQRGCSLERIRFCRLLSDSALPNRKDRVEEDIDEILDAIVPAGQAPVSYTKLPSFITEKRQTNPIDLPRFRNRKSKDVVIECKKKSLNHYKNQKYPNNDSVPLASKGWNHYKSKGDRFTIRVCDQEKYIESLYWDEASEDFNSFGLDENLIKILNENNFTRPTKIQAKAVPHLLSGRNCLITAETGCGKTLAYLIPLINQVLGWLKHLPARKDFNQPLALIMVPSRELANQIGSIAASFSYCLPFRSKVLVGGHMKKWMLNPEFEHVDIQVATPGALSKLVSTGFYDLSAVRHVILDEGDTMLDDSFSETVSRLLHKIKVRYGPSVSRNKTAPDNSQFTIVSATMPRDIYKVLDSVIECDSLTEVSTERVHHILPHVSQTFYRVGPSQKPDKLLQLVRDSLNKNEKIIIFSNQSKTSDWISLTLNEKNIKTVQLNKAMPEPIRRDKFLEFQRGDAPVLSCTDIASRGLDTIQVQHIINFDFPKFMADYVHRCGRTGRVGSLADCRVSNLISTENDIRLVQKIESSVRAMTPLPSVNGNISKIIQDRFEKLANLV